MIVFDLTCEKDHRFESWFRSSAAYNEQRDASLIECPYCGSTNIRKAPMAPNVGAKGNQKSEAAPVAVPTEAAPAEEPVKAAAKPAFLQSPEVKKFAEKAAKALAEMQKHVADTCENVGNRFAEEARKMHYGESEERGIYGESSVEEAQELIEEGIDIVPLPGLRRTDA